MTRRFIGTNRTVLIAGVASDLPFYLTYPPWLIIQGQFIGALKRNEWPEAPAWIYTAHHVALGNHSGVQAQNRLLAALVCCVGAAHPY